MPFPEPTKLEAKRRSHFQCCVCKEPFVEVHHITPQASGGSDDLDNAAPLCASCHDRFGGNPDKRKQIREMRDLWWEVCAERTKAPELDTLHKRLDQIQSGIAHTHATQSGQATVLDDLKSAFSAYLHATEHAVSGTNTISQFSTVSGVSVPPRLAPERPNQTNAAVLIQGPNAINISGTNAVVLGPNAIKIVGPIVHNNE
jgi:hypothetical protein